MQKGETGAALPRSISKRYGRELCNGHNARKKQATDWVGRDGKSVDRVGTFEVVKTTKKIKRRCRATEPT